MDESRSKGEPGSKGDSGGKGDAGGESLTGTSVWRQGRADGDEQRVREAVVGVKKERQKQGGEARWEFQTKVHQCG